MKIIIFIMLIINILEANSINIKENINNILNKKNINCSYEKANFRGKDTYNNEYYHIECSNNKHYMFMLDLEENKGRIMPCETIELLGMSCYKQLN